MRGEHGRSAVIAVATEGEIQERHASDLKVFGRAEDGEANLDEGAQDPIDFACHVKQTERAPLEVGQNLVDAQTSIVVRVVQVHVNRGEYPAANTGGSDHDIDRAECLNTGLQHHFGHVGPSAVRIGPIAHEQTRQEIRWIMRIDELFQTGRVITKSEMNLRAHRPAQHRSQRADDRNRRR